MAALSQEVLAAMNLKHLSHNFSHVLKQRNFAYMVSSVLLLCNVFLSLKVMNQDDHWVIIPWPETDRRLPLSRHNLTDRYLIDWADGLTSRLLTMNPKTADQRMYEFLLVTESSGGIEDKLKKQVQSLKSENISICREERCPSGLGDRGFSYLLRQGQKPCDSEKDSGAELQDERERVHFSERFFLRGRT
jgi:hypothetical protein